MGWSSLGRVDDGALYWRWCGYGLGWYWHGWVGVNCIGDGGVCGVNVDIDGCGIVWVMVAMDVVMVVGWAGAVQGSPFSSPAIILTYFVLVVCLPWDCRCLPQMSTK